MGESITFSQFCRTILETAIIGLRCNYFPENYDTDRPGWEDGNQAQVFDVKSSVFYFDWFFCNKEELFNAYLLLDDASSKKLFIDLVCFRLAGHLSIKLNLPWNLQTEDYREYKKLEGGEPSTLEVTGILGRLQHYDFEYLGNRYVADCKGFEYTLYRKQYFYENNGISVKPELGDVVIDGGACLGDTTIVFSNAVGISGKVLAFDPVADNLKILESNIKNLSYKNVILMPLALSDKDVDALPVVLNRYDPAFRVDDQILPLCRIDSLFENGLKKLDFIKLDIEGSELACLIGAKKSINEFRPKMAISLYHNPDDLFSIINYINHQHPFYRFFLGHYTFHEGETVLYCKPNS